ncbi:MAG: hypothetical protein GY883_19165 [Shimia sp.]|nr:hypothetical protein [Shimia sp.]
MRILINIFAISLIAVGTAFAHFAEVDAALPLGLAAIAGYMGGAVFMALSTYVGRVIRPPEYMTL